MTTDMSRSHVATALVTFAAGWTASAALRRLASRRRFAAQVRPVVTRRPDVVAADVVIPAAPAGPASAFDAVVLPFARRGELTPVAAGAAGLVRCGDSGGRTKAGAPCGARTASGGRCHHHRLAA